MILSIRRANRLQRASKSRFLRKAIFESLEDRRLLAASSGTASWGHLDVNRDGSVTALDALQVINVLEVNQDLSDSAPLVIEPRHDVNADGGVTAVDALWIINYLNEQDNESVTSSLQSEPGPTASISLPPQIRTRDIAELTIDSISNLDLATIDHLEIDWGDGRVTRIEDEFSLPRSRLHSYYIEPKSVLVEVRAVPLSGPRIVLQTATLEVIANSPAVIDRVNDGLTAEIFDNATFTGPSVRVRTDPTIDFDFGIGGPDPNLNIDTSPFSVRWQGSFTPEQTSIHTFFAVVGANDTADVYLDDVLLFTASGGEQSATIPLTTGQSVDVKVEYVGGAGFSKIRIGSETDSSFKTALPSHQLTPLIPASQLRSGVVAETFETIAATPPLTSVADLRADDAFIANTPTAASDLSSFSYAGLPAERASRIRGIVSPPVSGHYAFHLAASGEAELWLSQGVTSDTSRLIASVATPTQAEDFADPNAGVSTPVYLVAGQDYYVETLLVHDNPSAADHLSVAWTRPDEIANGPQLIDSEFLRPIVPLVSLHAEISQTSEVFSFDSTIRFVVVRDDDLGRDLPVAYTIGGTSENGVDYPLQNGLAIIPAGQRSAEIEFVSTKDGVAEPNETIVVRLVADSAYQLGSESTRQVIGTIIGEAIGGTELLPPDPVLLSSFSYYTVSSPNSVAEFEETDPNLPFVGTATGNNAIRVDVNSFTEPWDITFTHEFLPSALADDDKLFASVWARSANIDGSTVTVGMRLQEDDTYFGLEQTWEVESEWTPLLWPVIADFNNNVTSERSLDIRLGYQQQSVELAGMSLLKLPASTDMNSLPRTIFSYEGRDLDAAWRSRAQVDKQTQRSNPVQITIQDAAGNPVEGAIVTITPLAPSLPLGMQVSPARVVLSDDPYSQTAESARYRAIIETYFDILTDGGEAQWGPWEEDPQLPTDFLQWVVDRDYLYHGHSIIWGEMDRFPAPDDLLSGYQQVEATEGSEAAKTWLENEVLTHVTSGPAAAFSGTRGGSGEPLVTWWDVINHPILSDAIWDIVGDEFMLDVIDAARSTVHPDTRLIINEFDILSNPDEGLSDEFFNLLTSLDTLSADGRADYDTIGFQSHFQSQHLPAIDRILAELQRYRDLERDYHITEFDVDALFIDEQTQADFTRDFYEALASNQDVSVFTPWGFWEGNHWRSEEEAAFFNQDWTPKPNGQWLLDQTTEPLSASTTGLPLSFNGQGNRFSVQVTGDQYSATVEIDLRETEDEAHAIVVNYTPIAQNDSVATSQGTSITINLLADNGSGVDADPDADTLTIVSTMQPPNGTVVIDSDSDVTYTPNPSFIGEDFFEYTISDDNGSFATALVSISVTPPVVDLDDGLVSHWNFNGNALDSAPGGVKSDHGTLTGSATLDPSGLGGGSLRLTDSTSSFVVDNTNDINLGIHNQLSISLWFFADDLAVSGKQVLYEQGGLTRGLNLYLFEGKIYGGGWNLPANESGWAGNWINATIEAGKWHHVTLTLAAGSSVEPELLTLWLDGNKLDDVPGSQLWSHSDAIGIGAVRQRTRFHDGTVAAAATWFRGLIDELRIYDRKLNSPDVMVLASDQPVNLTSGLVTHWDFNSSNESVVPDVSLMGQTNNGTLTGSAMLDSSGLGGGSLRLIDSTSSFVVNNSNDINLGIHDQLSVSLWFYADDLDVTGKQVLYDQGGKTRGLNLYLFEGKLYGGGWNLPANESDWAGNWINATIEVGKWHHVTLTLEAGTSIKPDALTLWLNGNKLDDVPGSQLWAHADAIGIGAVRQQTRFHDGTSAAGVTWFRGLIDELKIYNRELRSVDVADLASEQPINLTSGLVAHWGFNSSNGSVVPDVSPMGQTNPGTLTGSAMLDPSGLGGGSLRLTDSMSSFMVGNSNDINLGIHDQFSVSLWFYADDLAVKGKQVLYEQGGITRGLNLYLIDGKLYGGAWNTPTNQSGWAGDWINTAIEPGKWHHITLALRAGPSIASNALMLWFDGVKVDDTQGSQLWGHADPIGVGAVRQQTLFHDGSSTAKATWFRGLIDELKIYDRELNSVDVAGLADEYPINPG